MIVAMQKIFFVIIIILLFVEIAFAKDMRVRSHIRKDGTYIQSHMKTKPNHTLRDNYSTKGNVNPYTEKHGTVVPDGRSSRSKSKYK